MGKIALIFSCGLLFACAGGESGHQSPQVTERPPLEIFAIDLSERGLVVAVIGDETCEFSAEQVREFQRNHHDLDVKQFDLGAAALAAAIECALAAGLPTPIQILADLEAAGAT